MFVSRMQKRTFEAKKNVIGGWRMLYIKSSFIIFTLHRLLLVSSIKESEIGSACNTHGKDKK
jgi:hypothetical protein